MAARRDYFDGCAAAHALDLVGERWALLVVRELMLGPKRFTDLRTGLPHASPNVLSQRLRELEDAGVLRRRRLPPPAASAVYELTEWGLELEPVLQTLGRWAARSLMAHVPDTDSHLGVNSCILSLRTMFAPEATAGVDLTVQLHLQSGGLAESFVAHVADGTLDVDRGESRTADVTVRCAPEDLAAVVHMGQPVDAAIADGAMDVSGDRAALERFADCFRMPAPLAVAGATPA